ncbi:MAG: hypothetical protein AABZ47_12855 [Planctomycetota bacterium]
MKASRNVLRMEKGLPNTQTRRRRFLPGATASGELSIARFSWAVRLMAVCGFLVALTALPTSACPVAELTVDPTYIGPGCCWRFGLYQYAGMTTNIVSIGANITTGGVTVASATPGTTGGVVTLNPFSPPNTDILWDQFDLYSNCSTDYQGIPTYYVDVCFNSTVQGPITVVFTGYQDDGNQCCVNPPVTLPLSDPGCVPCAMPPEECCFSDGSNHIQDPACCLADDGHPQGPGTGNVSLAPGACCLPDGSCLTINPYCCEDLGGTFQGPSTSCLGDNNADGIDDACCAAAPDMVINLTTGVGGPPEAPICLSPGQPDNTWTLISGPGGTVPFPRLATVVSTHPAWAPLPPCTWVSSNVTQGNGEPLGDYHYQTCFCLKDGFQNASLSFDLLADDKASVFLNGNSVPPGSTPPFALLVATPFLTTDQTFFHVGKNCIEVIVTNTFQTVHGFSLTGQVMANNARCCCEPAADGLSCVQATCDNPATKCLPTEVTCSPGNIDCRVTKCGCIYGNFCHTNLVQPFCSGGCPGPTAVGEEPCADTDPISTIYRCECPLRFVCSTSCDDGVFCNGCETSGQVAGVCQSGDPPCASGSDCGEIQGICVGIPTVSEWGLVVMTLLLMTGGKIYFARRKTASAT